VKHSLLRIDWTRVASRYLPFADAATAGLPLPRLLRLSLFQVSVGMAAALTVGTVNRVMIVELGVWSWLVALMVALPLLVAPLRPLVGWKSDRYRSVLGWRRVPFIWGGTMLMFGGLAIMPFALILLAGESAFQVWVGRLSAALAFLLVGAGAQTVQTTGLALATDLAEPAARPRVVALMYVMLLLGMVVSGIVFSLLLAQYTHTRLAQVVQGAAVVALALNLVAMWKQEPRAARRPAAAEPEASFSAQWRALAARGRSTRFLLAVGLGTLAFNMQDVILEPYGGEVLGLPVGDTSLLTGLMAAVLFAAPVGAPWLFRLGAGLIGLGGGLFVVGTLTAAMGLDDGQGLHGLVIGAWGAVQATCAGLAMALGGALRDLIGSLAASGALGSALDAPSTGYGFVYYLELILLLATLVVIGPLVRARAASAPQRFGLAGLPG
jgi:MFS transporter, BCD family, chlorophyll transporter